MTPYLESAESVISQFGSNEETGLIENQVEISRSEHGENTFTKEEAISVFKRIADAFKEPMLIILIIAAVITVAVNLVKLFTGGEADFFECAGIIAAIFLSVAITVVMEGKSAKAFEEISKLNEDTVVKVIRDGKTQMIPQKEVVAGDILCIATGDKIPADCRIIESNGIKTDESALTGESNPVKKSAEFVCESAKTPVAERKNMLYSGCFVTSGYGKAVVTAVGDKTEFGKIAAELSKTDESSTPLQIKMAKLGKIITILGGCAAGLVFIIQLIYAFMQSNLTFTNISDIFINSIVLIVASVPEGLPTIVAVSLALNIIKMSKQNALVKKMIACETVGSVNVICSDKTGTLTENKMTVTEIFEKGRLIKPEKLNSEILFENFCINSTADVHFNGNAAQFVGNPTECAILTAAHKAGVNYLDYRKNAVTAFVFPFSSETKNMTTVVSTEQGQTVYTKGSPEKILDMCDISTEEKAQAESKIRELQEKTCRVLGFAHKEVSEPYKDYEKSRSEIESGLTFDGFVSITDPLREDVYKSIDRCRKAGIEVKMLTGDNIVTACAIARELGILDKEHIAVEAREIEDLPQEEFNEAIKKIRVIARSTPGIKMKVVKALKAQGNVVAVTGDGINDAPAIKNADVGIAMGISGTEVSKQASDIVLLDDSFSTIARAVKWGRGIYRNIQRCIQFQLTVNVSSVAVVLTSIIAGLSAPFTALELLWINIIMDGPPALTLGLEPAPKSIMNESPTAKNASIVTKPMLANIAVNGIFISIIFMLQSFYNFLGASPDEMKSVLFTLFVIFQLFNAFNSRSLTNQSIFKSFFSNKPMLFMFLLTFGLQVIITQFGGAVFGTVPLSLAMWGKIILTAFSVIILSELLRLARHLISKANSKAMN